MKNWIFAILVLLISATTSAFSQINASHKNGELSFTGEHVGMKFKGVFTSWKATLILPPAIEPSINATFDLSSAKTGDSTYDSTLPEGDWFDVQNHPQAKFVSTAIVQKDKSYQVSGLLTLRSKSQTVKFVLNDTGKQLESSFSINRLDYDIGLDSDPDADWVSRDILITLVIDK